MSFCKSVDRTQLFNLLTGMLGIYILYFIAGILHESIVKRPHYNRVTKNYEICQNAAGMMVVPFVVAWLLGEVYNRIFITEKVVIPKKNSALAAFAVVAATYFSILAIQRTSFPVVIMFQSCSILPVVFIGVFCSRVHDPNLHLGPQKIIVALIITAGILTFQFADPQTRQRQLQQQFIGILFLIFHFVAQGFLPDLQAQIKINFKPQPTEMMADINKWCGGIALVVTAVTMSFWPFVVFMWEHVGFTVDLVVMSVVSGFGQFFVYRMIKQFKQHFVPFTISSRKILTATISIVFYGHKTNWIQILGISIVLFTVFVEFMIEISKKDPTKSTTDKQIVLQLNQQKFEQEIKSNQDGSSSKTSQLNPSIQKQQQQNQQKSMQQEDLSYRIKNDLKKADLHPNDQNGRNGAGDGEVNVDVFTIEEEAGYKTLGEDGDKEDMSKVTKEGDRASKIQEQEIK